MQPEAQYTLANYGMFLYTCPVFDTLITLMDWINPTFVSFLQSFGE